MNGLKRIWSRLFREMPQSPNDGYRYAGWAGRLIGGLEKRGNELLRSIPPAVVLVYQLADARIENISKRLARGLERLHAKADRQRKKAERHSKVANEAREERPAVDRATHGFADFFVSRVWIYLLTICLVVGLLESAGMYPSLIAWQSVLDDWRWPIAVTAGAILTLAGHSVGHLVHSAKDDTKHRPAYLIAAGSVMAVGIGAIIWLGFGRDDNTAAADHFASASAMEREAGRLDRQAEDPLPELPSASGEEASAEDERIAAGLRRQAEEMRQQAAQSDAEARDLRTLAFFAGVQVLGLFIGSVGGFFFAAAAPTHERLRLTRRANWHDRWAVFHEGRAGLWIAKAHEKEADIGRLVNEEWALAGLSTAHHDQNRVLARESLASSHHPTPEVETDIERIKRAIRPADLNGDDPNRAGNQRQEEQ